jgi:serine/threonine-protein kinase
MTDELNEGERFADYAILRPIGMGGMGRVYAAEHVFTGRRVALKIMHRHLAEDPEMRARAVQEARATAELRHKNIVALESANITPDGVVWIATEYLAGHTLREKLALSLRLGLGEALGYLIEVCDGVAAAHDIGIVHRDLKPENVFVTAQNAVKVLDFGAARAPALGIVSTTAELAERGGSRRVLGTPAYMAPEQARGERAGPAADIYAIGVMGYEMLARRHPFAEPDGGFPEAFELNRRQIEQAAEPLRRFAPQVPDFVERIVHRAMDKDPAKRQPSMSALASELRAARARLHDAPRKPFARQWTEPGSWAAHGPAFEVRPATETPLPSPERLVLPPQPPASPPVIEPPPLAQPAPGVITVAQSAVTSRMLARRRRAAVAVAVLLVAAALAAGALAVAAIVTQP